MTDPQFYTYNTRESNALMMRRSEMLKLKPVQEDSESEDEVEDLPYRQSITDPKRRYSVPFLLTKLKQNAINHE